MMRAISLALDPKNLMIPGKIFLLWFLITHPLQDARYKAIRLNFMVLTTSKL